MAPRFSELTNPLESAVKSEAAALFFSFNATKWVDDLHSVVNITDNTSETLHRVAIALQKTASTPTPGHYILLGALGLLLLREGLLQLSVRRALKREHEE